MEINSLNDLLSKYGDFKAPVHQRLMDYFKTLAKAYDDDMEEERGRLFAGALARIPCIVQYHRDIVGTSSSRFGYAGEGCQVCQEGQGQGQAGTSSARPQSSSTERRTGKCVGEIDLTMPNWMELVVEYALGILESSTSENVHLILLPILERLKLHEAPPESKLTVPFVGLLNKNSFDFGLRLMRALSIYFETGPDVPGHLASMYSCCIKLTFQSLSSEIFEGRLRASAWLGGFMEMSTTRNRVLTVELLKMITKIIVRDRDPCTTAKCLEVVSNISKSHGCTPEVLFTRYRHSLFKEISQGIRHCLPQSNPQTLGSKKFKTQCKSVVICTINRITYIGQFPGDKVRFIDYMIPLLLADVLSWLNDDDRATIIIEALADYCGTTDKVLLTERFNKYFPALVIEYESDTVKCAVGFLVSSRHDKELIRVHFQDIVTQLATSLSIKKDHIIQTISTLINWNTIGNFGEWKVSKKGRSSSTWDEVYKCLTKRVMGIYMHLNSKLLDANEAVETKSSLISSLLEIMKLVGPEQIRSCKGKLFTLISSLSVLEPELHGQIALVWWQFLFSLDEKSLFAFLPQSLAVIMTLKPPDSSPKPIENKTKKARKSVVAINSSQDGQFIKDMVAGLLEKISESKELKDLISKLYFVPNIPQSLRDLSRINGNELLSYVKNDLADNNSFLNSQALHKFISLLKENTNVKIHELILKTESVSNLICELIRSLVNLASSQKKEKRILSGAALGYLSAVDPYRVDLMFFKNAVEKRPSGIFATDMVFRVRFLEELRMAFQGDENVQDVDIFSLCIQEVLKYFKITASPTDEIWSSISDESRILFEPLLNSKYSMTKDSPDLGVEFTKTNHNLKDFSNWCRYWCLKLITKIDPGYAKNLFEMSIPVIHISTRFCQFILPHAIFYSIVEDQEDCFWNRIIQNMLNNSLQEWITFNSTSDAMSDEESQSGCTFIESMGSGENRGNSSDDPHRPDLLRRTHCVFTIVDHLRQICRKFSTEHAKKDAQMRRSRKNTLDGTTVPVSKEQISQILGILPSLDIISRSAFHGESFQRSLLMIEQFYYYENDSAGFSGNLPYLQRIHVALDDLDSASGVTALRKNYPSANERILDDLSAGKKENAMSSLQYLLPDFEPLSRTMAYHTLIRSYNSMDLPHVAQILIDGYTHRRENQSEESESGESEQLREYKLEALRKLGQWDQLEAQIKEDFVAESWNSQVSTAFLCLKKQKLPEFSKVLSEARAQIMEKISATTEFDVYHRRYSDFVRLHILAEIEQVASLLYPETGNGECLELISDQPDTKVEVLLENWKERLDCCQKSLRVTDELESTRRTLLGILKDSFCSDSKVASLLNDAIRDCWIHVAKAESLHGNYKRAAHCLREAHKSCTPVTFIQEAKLSYRKGEHDITLDILWRGIHKHFPDFIEWGNIECGDEVDLNRKLCSKALSLFAKINDEKNKVDKQVNIDNYTLAAKINSRSEENFFQLAIYHEKLWQDLEDPFKNGPMAVQVSTLEKWSEVRTKVVEYFCTSLRYGTKHVYQSLPSLLSHWFEYAAYKLAKPPGNRPALTNTEQEKIRKVYNDTVQKMTTLVTELVKSQPSYIFLTAFSQLISRLCHSNQVVWDGLKEIIALIGKQNPHQCLWMMMAVSRSSYEMRKTRSSELINLLGAKDHGIRRMSNDYITLASSLIDLANFNVPPNSNSKYTIHMLASSIPKLLNNRSFSNILIPHERFLSPSLPRVKSKRDLHNPFPLEPVYITGIEDKVVVMPSLQQPKRIVFRGSNGRTFAVMCKPKDDLRKDSKVMEMNQAVNWYLGRDIDARERQLKIRTYAVVPLNEECGLVEWVSNLSTMRQVLLELYSEKKVGLQSKELSKIIPANATFEEKLTAFTTRVLPGQPVMLPEWFFRQFPDPQEWYRARLRYIRTLAVMSMVGYILGLGDRHTENILLDSETGEVIHVDFNCLFNRGETFTTPERVPFRLTHNMTAAMGVMGYEGVFRRSCEITAKVLRENGNVFISILHAFVFDPLVEWGSCKNKSKDGEVTNEKAVESLTDIRNRLEGKARNFRKDLDVPLSPDAQVEYLITEASSPVNLCQMYLGWGPHY